MDYEELHSALCSKGKAEEDRTGDHVYFYVEVGGRMYRATKFSHNARGQISKDLLSEIAHQMRLTTGELKQFDVCLISREQWLKLWSQRGHTWWRA